jgi:hypothetical protein
MEAASPELGRPPLAIPKMSVAAVYDGVAGLEKGHKLREGLVHGTSRLDHEDEASWPFERAYKIGQRGGGLEGGTVAAGARHEIPGPLVPAVIDAETITVIEKVERQVPSHDGESVEADIAA